MISDRSRKALTGVHPDLVKVIEQADSNGVAFVVTCGRRTLAEQKTLVATGKSKTLHSRHLTGHAVDLADAAFTWHEDAMRSIAEGVKKAAAEVQIPIEWGGDWKSFQDTPHFQLPFAAYPDTGHDAHAPTMPLTTSVQVNPPHKSHTIWSIVGVLIESTTGVIEKALFFLTEAATKFNDLQPVHGMLAQVGANTKAVSLGLISTALIYAASRRIKAGQEGKPG